jgi:hypothetical protein
MLKELYFNVLTAEGVFSSCRAFGTEQQEFVNGEVTFV